MDAFFKSILDGIYSVVNSYGWTIILFTVLFRLVLTPLDFKSKKSMRRMEKINPQLQEIQKKYANDKEKQNKKTSELYKKEKINPLGGCLPVLLSLPVILIIFNAMRSVANRELIVMLTRIFDAVGDLTDPAQVEAALPVLDSLLEPFLWIKNLWVADSPFTSILPNSSGALAAVGRELAGVITEDGMVTLRAFMDGEVYQNIVLPFYGASPLPGGNVNLLITTLQLFKLPNGFLVLPVLCYITSYLQTMLTPQQAQPSAQTGGMGGFMKWGMPLFMAYICISSSGAFALYYVVSNVLQIAQQFIFRKYFEAQDAKELALAEGGK